MLFFAQPRRFANSGFGRRQEVRSSPADEETSIPFPSIWNLTTMAEAAEQWEAKLKTATHKRQQCREKFRAALTRHQSLCEIVAPMATKDRLIQRFFKSKKKDSPLYELDQIRKHLHTLSIERGAAEDHVLSIIREFRIYANQLLSHYSRLIPIDQQERLEHALDFSKVRLSIIKIYGEHYFSERVYMGDTAILLWQMWRSEVMIRKISRRAYEVQDLAEMAEELLGKAEEVFLKTAEQQVEATASLTAALSAVAAARRTNESTLHRQEVAKWLALCRNLFSNYTTLTTFPEPPKARCDDNGCADRKEGRALGVCECSVREALKALSREELKWMRIWSHPDKFSVCWPEDEERRGQFKRMAHEVNVVVNEVWRGVR